jgi:GTPase SAR1 family protein
MPPRYGQVVVGPPGSGKTTYCDGMQQYLRLLGREPLVINLDPANEGGLDVDKEGQEKMSLPYETLFDVCEEVVNLSSVMKETGLGPNGGLVYCMEYLEAHVDDIIEKIQGRLKDKVYLLFDLPGQVELYTHSTCVQSLLGKLVKVLDLRLTAVQLIDAHYCTDGQKFLSAALLGTTTMLRLELPTVNVLSKVDLLANYGELPMNLEFFTECQDLDRLVPFLDNERVTDDPCNDDEFAIADDLEYQQARKKRRDCRLYRKFTKLHEALAEVVEDYGLLNFIPLDISQADSVGRVLARIDKCNGYVFTEGSVNEDLFQCAIRSDDTHENLADIQERIQFSRKKP